MLEMMFFNAEIRNNDVAEVPDDIKTDSLPLNDSLFTIPIAVCVPKLNAAPSSNVILSGIFISLCSCKINNSFPALLVDTPGNKLSIPEKGYALLPITLSPCFK